MPKRKQEHKRQPLPPPGTVRIKSSRYQPSKKELEEEVRIPTTPERLAKALGRKVDIEYED